jgi:hypothetical protein
MEYVDINEIKDTLKKENPYDKKFFNDSGYKRVYQPQFTSYSNPNLVVEPIGNDPRIQGTNFGESQYDKKIQSLDVLNYRSLEDVRSGQQSNADR